MTNNELGRPDFDLIASWVQPGERVLDLGCGDGALLKLLQKKRGARAWGVELDDKSVLAAIANGVNVIQSNLEETLGHLAQGKHELELKLLEQFIQG